MFVTFDVLKLDTSIASKSHPSNILFISFTFNVSKCDKSRYFNFWHPQNICCMFVTFDVLKLDTSIASKPHLLNMLLISFTFNVSKDETSIDARLLQPENISLIFVTFDVTKLFTFNDANLLH